MQLVIQFVWEEVYPELRIHIRTDTSSVENGLTVRGLRGEVLEDKEQDALEKKHMDGLIRVKQIVNILV